MRGASYNKRMRRILVLATILACGGRSVEWAGKWKQPTGIPPASWMECTLDGSGDSITGSGIQHREAGADQPFTVNGSACKVVTCVAAPSVTLSYDGGTTEVFTFSQPDSNHITLSNSNRAVDLVRQ